MDSKANTGYRIERDSMGEIQVPADKYWGAQTQRSTHYFNIGLDFIPDEVIRALAVIKKASAIANEKSGRLKPDLSKAICNAADEILAGKLDGTDVCINLADPDWCRTDLGGPNAPNDPDSVIPGIIVGAFIDDKKSGRYLGAQDFAGMSLEEAVKKAANFPQKFL